MAGQISLKLHYSSASNRRGQVIEWGVHIDQFSIEGSDNRMGGVHVSQFSIKRVPNRRGSILVRCSIKWQWNYWGEDTGVKTRKQI